jgi:ferric-dicitrate binding protein FerR (iron transport regulator)
MPIGHFGREGKLKRRGVLAMKLALILAVFLASFSLVETSRAQSSSSTSSTGTVEAIAIADGSAASNVAGATYAEQTARQ